MSLGSPLQNNIMYSLLELLRMRHNMPVFASGGNARRAPAQYPASYSSGVAVIGQPSLANVISVASLGWKSTSGYEIAAFNTRANADVFAFGVDLCPDTALGFRCSSLLPTPGNLGITGSSFSAPIQAGLAALLIQRKGGLPTDLHACIRNNRKTDSVTGIQYGALTTQACP
jgi:subtilisin family serine protease